MLRPQGYVTVYFDDGKTLERDTCSCGHCSAVIMVKPGTACTTYLIPQVIGPPKEEPGAFCRNCMRAICLSCHAIGICTPLMRMIEQNEAKGRQLAAMGIV